MSTFDVTLLSKMKHGKLFAAAEKLGGQSALARHLGVSVGTAGHWCNMRACPPTCEDEIRKNSRWTPNRIQTLENKLYALTGCTLDELFPHELRSNQELLDAPKTQSLTKTIETKQLASEYNARLLLPDPSVEAEKTELRDRITKVFRYLKERERKVLRMRFGIGDDAKTYTLEETAAEIHVTRERIRQIESKGIRKLRLLWPEGSEV